MIGLVQLVILIAKLCPTLLQPHRLQPTKVFCPWDFPGKNTEVSCHFLLSTAKIHQYFYCLPEIQI